jgi:hypothetical protein
MTFFVPHAASHAIPSRQDRLAERHPQAVNAIQSIEASTVALPFGAKILDILSRYHFLPRSHVDDFFRIYLERRHGYSPATETIGFHSRTTLNCLNDEENSGQNKILRAFHRVFEQTLATISDNCARGIPTLQFNLGPTGAGKTVFSKYLFTVCAQKFWQHAIVTSRIEYSKFEHRNQNESVSSKEFYAYVRKCLFRDLIIYLFLSGRVQQNERDALTIGFHSDPEALRILAEISKLTSGKVIDGESATLSRELRNKLTSLWEPLSPEIRDTFLYRWTDRLKLKFLISFDGFDCVRIEDFLFLEKPPAPVQYLSILLKEMHEKRGEPKLFARSIEAHYFVYLRDTTFERLRVELFTSVGGEIKYPVYWIVPPKYEMLVENVANFVTKYQVDDTSTVSTSAKFSDDMFRVFDRFIFNDLKMTSRKHLSFLFGSNARRMNQHIRQTFLSMLSRASQSDDYDFARYAGGIGLKAVWSELIQEYGPISLPRYVLFEDLFLGDTRQLIPKLRLDPNKLTRILSNDGSIEDAIRTIDDADETNSIFGCLLNYALPGLVAYELNEKPAFLIFVRAMQFININPRCTAGEIFEFLKKVGYQFAMGEFHFLLYILIRTEMVKWDATTNGRSITDVPLYITTRGIIAITKILPSVSYMSEAIISCLHNDRSYTNLLKNRIEEGRMWIVDCVFNAVLAIEMFRETEEIESKAARNSGVPFEQYLITPKIIASVSAEANTILRYSFGRAATKSQSNNEFLAKLRTTRFPNLITVGA